MHQKSFVELFDQVRIINMTSRTDRRQETVAEFKRGSLPIETGTIRFFPAITPDTAEGFSSRGARGCYMSHLEVLREAQQQQARHVLILEDDIAFVRNINTLGSHAFLALQELAWDVAYFGHVLPSSKKNPHWQKVDQAVFSAHCYAINGSAINKLVELLETMLTRQPGDPLGGPMHYDGALNWFFRHNDQVNAYYYTHCLGYQRPSATNIHALGKFDRLPGVAGLMTLARYLKREYLRVIN